MSEFVTRCPKCATAFRISDSLLNSPKGVVRCGSCMNVFNAKQHLVQRKAIATADNSSQGFQFFDRQTEDPAGNRGDKQTDKTITRSPRDFPPYSSDTSSPSNLFERSVGDVESKGELTIDEDEVDDDEAWALELLKDDSEPDVKLKKITEPNRQNDGQGEPTSISTEPPSIESLADVELDIPDTAEQHDETFFEEALPPLDSTQKNESKTSDIESKPEDSKQTESSTPPASNAPMDSSLRETSTAKQEAELSRGDHYPSKQSAPSSKEANSTTPLGDLGRAPAAKLSQNRQNAIDKYTAGKESFREVVAQIEPEPLEVSWQGDKIHWLRRLMWPFLVIVALTVLLVQVAWLEFHRLNRTEPYRSVYGVACQVLGCQLPALVDRSAVRTSNLLVRSHPDVENALMVDVILQNNAEFEQSFPSLLLTFTDMRGKPLAVRKLSPNEYLGGELSGASTMPVRQPIHISLEIVDPGQNAVSYHIEIVD